MNKIIFLALIIGIPLIILTATHLHSQAEIETVVVEDVEPEIIDNIPQVETVEVAEVIIEVITEEEITEEENTEEECPPEDCPEGVSEFPKPVRSVLQDTLNWELKERNVGSQHRNIIFEGKDYPVDCYADEIIECNFAVDVTYWADDSQSDTKLVETTNMGGGIWISLTDRESLWYNPDNMDGKLYFKFSGFVEYETEDYIQKITYPEEEDKTNIEWR